MKQAILIALALTCVCATQVEKFEFGVGDWIGTLFNRFVLQIVLAFYGVFAMLFAIIGQPLWFTTNAWNAVTGQFKLPAYDQMSNLNSQMSFTFQE